MRADLQVGKARQGCRAEIFSSAVPSAPGVARVRVWEVMCHGDGGHERGDRRRRASMLAILSGAAGSRTDDAGRSAISWSAFLRTSRSAWSHYKKHEAMIWLRRHGRGYGVGGMVRRPTAGESWPQAPCAVTACGRRSAPSVPPLMDGSSRTPPPSVGFMSGFAVSASRLCTPDAELISYGELVDQGQNMCRAMSIPIIGAGDTRGWAPRCQISTELASSSTRPNTSSADSQNR
jgi:hypothetical protein